MRLERLELTDFRSHASLILEPNEAITVIVGTNGSGKTNLVEAIVWLATQMSFRGAPNDALVRVGAEKAILRAHARRDARDVLVEAEVNLAGRNRLMMNRQRVSRVTDLIGTFQTTVFAPDDLTLIKQGPGERRRFVDSVAAGLHARHLAEQRDVEKILKQRNALLRGAGGRLDADAAFTLEVWDAKLVEAGERLSSQRRGVLEAMSPLVDQAYDVVAGERESFVELVYTPGWSDDLASALMDARGDDVRRGVSTVGPHRDEVVIRLDGLAARTHSSQGEQRCLALAAKLVGHQLVGDRVGATPILILDDVFSELDPGRSAALLGALPPGQVLVTTAGVVPEGLLDAKVISMSEMQA